MDIRKPSRPLVVEIEFDEIEGLIPGCDCRHNRAPVRPPRRHDHARTWHRQQHLEHACRGIHDDDLGVSAAHMSLDRDAIASWRPPRRVEMDVRPARDRLDTDGRRQVDEHEVPAARVFLDHGDRRPVRR